MFKAINNLINWGIQINQSPLTKRRIRLLNIIAWAGVVIFLGYIPLFIFIHDFAPLIMNLLGAFILFVILIFNKKHYYHYARIGLCLDLTFFFTVASLGLGKAVGLQYFLISTSILPILFFNNKKTIALMFALTTLCLIGLQISFEYVPPFLQNIRTDYSFIISIINLFNTSLVLLISIGSFKMELLTYQKTIEENNLALKESSEEIKTQNLTIQNKNDYLSDAYQQITDSVMYAQRIQNALLGEPELITSHFPEAFILLKPKDIVSGDFYWFSNLNIGQNEFSTSQGSPPISENLKFLVAADCTGHGVPGAFMTVMGSNFLDEIVNEQKITDPAEILYNLDQKIAQALKQENTQVNDGMDLAMLVWNEAQEEIYFAGAKNPLYYVRANEIFQIKGSAFPIGSHQYKSIKNFKTHRLKVQKGDIFYMFSDGFQDQFGGKQNRKYYKKNFREFLLRISHFQLEEQKLALNKEFRDWKGTNEQTDDILVVGVKV